jgi:hypothetical protein
VTGRQDRFAAGSVDAVASTLNQLIQTCRDGENGFASAATAPEEPSLRRLFQSYSQQRTEFAAEQEEETALGNYERALDSPLPNDLRIIVERQFGQIKEAHEQIRSLEHTHTEADSH